MVLGMNKKNVKGLDLPTIENSWGFKGKNYLFTIGIDKYEHWPTLQCAVKDVKDFTNLLIDRYQFDEKNVITLHDKKATEKNILTGFRKLVGEITEEDNLVIYFSGHGHYDEVTKTGYWIPVDAHQGEENEYEFINTAIIVDRLKNINSLHTFLIVDACFSGTLVTQIRATPRSERYKSRRVFTSGREEVVEDGPEGGNSPFASGILNYLKKNTEKYIAASRLILDVREYVEKQARQTPTDARLVNADDQGGDFVFYLKMSEAEIWASTVEKHTREAYKKFMEQFPESKHMEEAQDNYDWLKADEENTIRSLQEYLDTYRPDGRYVSEAIKHLSALEEEKYWENAKRQETLTAYYEYLVRYPEGKYVDKAEEEIQRKKGQGEDDQKIKEEVKKKVESEPDTTISSRGMDMPDENKAWTNAKNADNYIAYLEFARAFPESEFTEKAEQEMKRLDDIALNRIRLMEQNRSLSLQDKIEQCLQYFNSYPGAQNNRTIKQIKDRLQMKEYSQGRQN